MVLLAGLGTAISMFLIYRNKNRIGFELIKYYTYLDEYLASKLSTQDSKLVYYRDQQITESVSINNLLLNLNSINNFFISYDFIVKSRADESKSDLTKEFYTIYILDSTNTTNTINTNTNINNVTSTSNDRNTIIKRINSVYSVNDTERRNEQLDEMIFNNKIENFETYMEWKCPIIAASMTIKDNDNIINYSEYDITQFVCGLARPDKTLILDNLIENKKLWIFVFNYLFKSKNIYIQPDNLQDIEISWTIIMDSCVIHTGNDLKIDFK